MQVDQAAELVERRVAAARAELDVPGIAWGLMRHGELVASGGAGESVRGSAVVPGPDTVFRIASMTKSFTASAVLLLRDRGALRLDDPVVEHCPWVDTIGTPADSHPLTIRDLLTMQAGLPTDDPWGDRQESLPIDQFDELVASGLMFTRPPRTRFEYSNLGYALLGRVISQVSGQEYTTFMRQEVLEPLGLTSTRFEVADVPMDALAQGYAPVADGLVDEPFAMPGAFSPMGGLLSTISDLAVWVAGFQDALRSGSAAHPLGATSRREMQTPHLFADTIVTPATDDSPQKIVTLSYAYGLRVDDVHGQGRFICHSGGYPGFGSHMRWHAESGWALVGLGNRTYANMTLMVSSILGDIVAQTSQESTPELWPETLASMGVAESLLSAWDDALADEHVAVNIDLDRPRAERRAEWESVGRDLGAFTREDGPVESDSPAHARWWVSGEGGRARIEVRLSPERPPRIQTLGVAREG